MASPAVLDFDRLLAPIPGEHPAGVDLRQDLSPKSIYQQVKGAAAKARGLWRKRLEGAADADPDWGPILQLVPDAIADVSKDLELATCLIEALLQKHGFAGLRDGLRLARELAETYWDDLYPLPDEEGHGVRVAMLAGLVGRDREGVLIDEINNVPLTEAGPDDVPFVRWRYRQADALELLEEPEARQSRIAEGAVTVEMIRRAEDATAPAFAAALQEDLADCLGEVEKLDVVLDTRCGLEPDGTRAAPSLSMVRVALRDCLAIVEGYAAETTAPAGGGAGAENAAAERASAGRAAPAASGMIQSREDAFQLLLKVARFFKDTEPHSPVSYALERIVKWGKMPLPDLLIELIAERGSREDVFKLVGIPQRDEE